MRTSEIIDRIGERLKITQLMPMQKEMSTLTLPARVLLTAPTGSGKTLAFTIALLRTLPSNAASTMKALVIAPTRELVLQIFEVVRTLSAPEFKTTAVYGGHSFATEANSLEANPDIVVGTPGRILDHLRRGRLSLFDATTLVIDEFDKALELGFLDDMRAIAGRMKKTTTVILTSATQGDVPDFIAAPEHVLDFSESTETVRPDITVYEVKSDSADKLDTLVLLLRRLQGGRLIVFVNHRDAAERVYTHLKKLHFPAGLYHGGLEQQMRERALILFDNGTTPILVSTDLASRGLDIQNVDAVIHYHMPVSEEVWTHRNGRTARMGTTGQAYTIISDQDKVPVFIGEPSKLDMLEPVPSEIMDAKWGTLYLNVGRKEKISKADIAGFVMKKGELTRDEVGKINVGDHCAYVAVAADKLRATAVLLNAHKIKNTRVRVTQIKE